MFSARFTFSCHLKSKLERIDMKVVLTRWLSSPVKYDGIFGTVKVLGTRTTQHQPGGSRAFALMIRDDDPKHFLSQNLAHDIPTLQCERHSVPAAGFIRTENYLVEYLGGEKQQLPNPRDFPWGTARSKPMPGVLTAGRARVVSQKVKLCLAGAEVPASETEITS